MESALSYLTVLPSTKEEVLSFSTKVIREIDSGHIGKIKIKRQLIHIQKAIEIINKSI